ncbi:hypothetical protein JKP88DRAFT_221454 [Tribonema minus]|uniref:Uncharacterized protein n=1 Tax=Tribonema minus TaxID=303371 RepID=A0A835YVC2_9STRA|nr:hypothetical protein JKP88DRAFT_221454 [Tribonema minus]
MVLPQQQSLDTRSHSMNLYTRKHDNRAITALSMAAEGKKKRRRKRESSGTREESGEASRVADIQMTQDTGFNPELADLFVDDWSGMQAPRGMKDKKDAKEPLPSKDGKTELPDLKKFESQLTPISGMKPEVRELTAAERFQEGNVVKAIKAATWFALLSLVAWEIYLHSPFFKPPGQV